ncbi:MAG: M20/M25/M40 family metallo-hydrolase [Thermoanaerobaculia bacterium]
MLRIPRGRRPALALTLCSAMTTGVAAARIEPTVIRQRVEFLASDGLAGRASGSEGGMQAARYIADAFRIAGLKALGSDCPGDVDAALDGSGYFQAFSFPAGVTEGKGNFLSARHTGKYFEYRPDVEFVASSVSGNGRVEGDAVFAGYGIIARDPARDDYGDLDVRGKVVLLLAGSPGNDPRSPLAVFAGMHHKVLFARDRGAAAVLVVAPRDTDLPDPSSSRSFSDEGIPVLLVRRSLAQSWLATAGWTLASAESRLAGERLALALPVRVSLSSEVRKIRKTTQNVAGLLEGSDPALRNEYVVIGAHYDHLGMGGPSSLAESPEPAIHHGADDNASGTAGVIALAEDLASRSPHPKRSILFLAFSGEELGLLGSSYYVGHPLVPSASTVAMFNMDMIGRLRGRRLTVIGTETSPSWEPLLVATNRENASSLILQKTEGGFGASDQQSFYAAKIPVLFFFTGGHSDYHKPSDTADRINAAGEAAVLDLIEQCALRVANGRDRPPFRELPPTAVTASRQFRVWFGLMPDPSSEVDGVKLAGVRAGSPAAKAGLQAGDVMVRFGRHDIRSVDDYSIAISEGSPGDEVEVIVTREGTLVSLHAVLEAPNS